MKKEKRNKGKRNNAEKKMPRTMDGLRGQVARLGVVEYASKFCSFVFLFSFIFLYFFLFKARISLLLHITRSNIFFISKVDVHYGLFQTKNHQAQDNANVRGKIGIIVTTQGSKECEKHTKEGRDLEKRVNWAKRPKVPTFA